MKELTISYNLSEEEVFKNFLQFSKIVKVLIIFLVSLPFFSGSGQEFPETCPAQGEEKELRLRRMQASADYWRFFKKNPFVGICHFPMGNLGI
jgi:hypothetical protein